MLVRVLITLFLMVAMASAEGQQTLQRKADQSQVGEVAGWMRRVGEQQRALTNQPAECCVIGDSLTEYWPVTAVAGWEEMKAKWKLVNLGTAGDRTEQVLYRIKALDFSRARIKAAVLWIGTNNLSAQPADSADGVTKAILLCARQLQAKLPRAKVLVIGLAPNGPDADMERKVKISEVNELLSASLDGTSFQFVPIYPDMADEQGRWRNGLSTDGTHLSVKGYEVVGKILSPLLKAAMQSEGTN